VLTIWFCWSAFAGLVAGFAVAAVIPGALAGVSAWITAAWQGERSWPWWVMTLGCALALVQTVALVGSGPVWATLVGLAINGGMLALLLHADCRVRAQGSVADQRPTRDPAAPWVGRDY
jgi:hypothetical protein